MWTRPRRSSRAPCAATYAAGATPLPISHCARPAFRLPVTGSSGTPIDAANARTSNRHAERREHGPEHARVDFGDAQRRRGERQARSVAPHPHEAHAALLHDLARVARHAAGLQPRVAAAERRVAREGEFAAGREDAHPVVGRGVGGRQQEGGLAQIRPARVGLHLRIAQTVRVVHHGQRVAEQRRVGEHVDLREAAVHARSKRSARNACASSATPRSISGGATVTNDSRSVFGFGSVAKNAAPGT
jgi:hypothetical protein